MKKTILVSVSIGIAFVYGYVRGHQEGFKFGRERGDLEATRRTLRSLGFDEDAIRRQTT